MSLKLDHVKTFRVFLSGFLIPRTFAPCGLITVAEEQIPNSFHPFDYALCELSPSDRCEESRGHSVDFSQHPYSENLETIEYRERSYATPSISHKSIEFSPFLCRIYQWKRSEMSYVSASCKRL